MNNIKKKDLNLYRNLTFHSGILQTYLECTLIAILRLIAPLSFLS